MEAIRIGIVTILFLLFCSLSKLYLETDRQERSSRYVDTEREKATPNSWKRNKMAKTRKLKNCGRNESIPLAALWVCSLNEN